MYRASIRLPGVARSSQTAWLIPGASPGPLVRAFGELGMVLILPAPRSFAECVALLSASDFPFHQVDDKGGALWPATLSIAAASCRGIGTTVRGLRIRLLFSEACPNPWSRGRLPLGRRQGKERYTGATAHRGRSARRPRGRAKRSSVRQLLLLRILAESQKNNTRMPGSPAARAGHLGGSSRDGNRLLA
jgi:hypothetical protein